MQYKGFTLDKFQEDAITSINNNHSVVVSAPTGSGKTLIADYIINKFIKKNLKIIYTAPIKALSNQKYKEFCDEYGEENIGLLTGDIVRNAEAQILIMTTEIYRNMVLTQDTFINDISYVIFDEIHYINDIERGYVWEESIIFSNNKIRFLCLSATIPNAEEFASWISSIKKHNVDVIKQTKRNVPLERKFYDSTLGVTTLDAIQELKDVPTYEKTKRGMRKKFPPKPDHIQLIREIKDRLPCLFFVFSRKACQDNAKQLSQTRVFQTNPKIEALVRKRLSNINPEINNLKTTKLLRQTLAYGIAFHHAGLIPVLKELVEELFSQGLINVLYATETFAVGINMPVKTVCFEALRKFDGVNFRPLNSKEYFQIAGRAGRRGIDKKGFVYAMINRRDFDYYTLKRMTTKDVDPIKSQFKLSVNTVLNLIDQHNQKEIDTILCQNFFAFQKFGKKEYENHKSIIFNSFNKTKKKLLQMNYLINNDLTEKGYFSSLIYSDEILYGELFGTDFYKNLNEFHILLLIATLCFEPREKTEIYNTVNSKFLQELEVKIINHPYFKKEKRFKQMKNLTGLLDPIYHGKDIFDILKNTNLLEGDLIRYFRQILDRIGQIKKATKDEDLINILKSCQSVIINALKDIDVL